MKNNRSIAAGGGFVAIVLLALANPGGIGTAHATDSGVHVSPGLVLPPMDAGRGKTLFASKGCVVCHAINGVGGTDAPSIAADTMSAEMNPFDFVAKMWNHSEGMIAMQMEELGHLIEFKDGGEIADIIAFLHDADIQKTFTEDDVPADFKGHMHEDMDSMEGMEGGEAKKDSN